MCVQPGPLTPQEHRKAFQLMWLGFLKHKVGPGARAGAGAGAGAWGSGCT